VRNKILLLVMACLALAWAYPALSAGKPGEGRFVVKPPRVSTAALRQDAREMHDSGVLQELAKAMNGLFLLPRDVSIRFAECGESNAFYDSEAYEILMCLELMQGMAETLEGQFEDEESTADALAGAFIAVALHEIGHALVHVLELPITGREEDAVDQLAAWMLIKADDVGSVLGAAATYYTDEDLDEAYLAGEHALSKQRYFNMVCWVYGADPDNGGELIEVWELPAERAERCPDEYALLDRSWTRILKGHLRDDAGSGPQVDPVADRRPVAEPPLREAPGSGRPPRPAPGTSMTPVMGEVVEKPPAESILRTVGKKVKLAQDD